MNIEEVIPKKNFMLYVKAEDGKTGLFDVKPYLNIGIFQELQDMSVFNSVKPFLGSVQWENGQDFCPDTLYMDSVPETNLAETMAGEKAVA